MIPADELREQVMSRLASLGPGAHSASVVAHHGERVETGVVWRCLDDLWVAECVTWHGDDRYGLPASVSVQMRMGDDG